MKRALPLVLCLLVVAAIAYAQIRAYDANPPGEPGGPPRFGPAPVAPVMFQGSNGFLYILRGDQLLKINSESLAVDKQTMLPRPEPPKPPVGN